MGFDISQLPSHLVSKDAKEGANLPPEVKVGEGATVSYGSDRYPHTVISVRKNGKQIVVQRDKAELVSDGGIYGKQEYKFSPDPYGATITLNWAPSKKRFGEGAGSGSYWTIGSRRKYLDHHF